jgi:hypothetical protein
MAKTEALARSRPKFQSREAWQVELAKLTDARHANS